MAQFDMNEVLALLSIPEKVANVAPQLTHISGEAMSRLRKIEEGLVNERRAQQKLPPVENPTVIASKLGASPEAQSSNQLDFNPTPSEPVDDPKSKVAEKAPDYEAKAKAERDAKARADYEARAKADADARRNTEIAAGRTPQATHITPQDVPELSLHDDSKGIRR
jgi:colicin import membrane protein